jgi:DNA-binding MarR family transcriptional regulator
VKLAIPIVPPETRWQVLDMIGNGPASVAEVARVYGLARQSVQRTADTLVRDGLAVYEENPRHRRAKLLRLTPAGNSALDAMQVAQRAWADALGAELGETDLRQAAEVLQRVRHALETRPSA